MTAATIVIRVLWQDGLPPVGTIVDVFDAERTVHLRVYRREDGTSWGQDQRDGSAGLCNADVLGWRTPLSDVRKRVLSEHQRHPITDVLPQGSGAPEGTS